MAPLSGVKVLEVGGLVSIPYAGRLLADLGADVLQVEPSGGAELRRVGPFNSRFNDVDGGGLHLYLNRSKRAVTLDHSTETGRSVLRALVEAHDVVLHDLDAD